MTDPREGAHLGDSFQQFADEAVKTYLEGERFPGLPQVLARMQKEELGRPITRRKMKQVGEFGEPEDELVGYILPITDTGTEHMVILLDGLILSTRPQPEVGAEDKYKTEFRPNSRPLRFAYSNREFELGEIVDSLTSGAIGRCKIEIRSDDSAESAQLASERFMRAMEIAPLLKEKRKKEAVQARDNAVITAIELFNSIYPPEESPEPGKDAFSPEIVRELEQLSGGGRGLDDTAVSGPGE